MAKPVSARRLLLRAFLSLALLTCSCLGRRGAIERAHTFEPAPPAQPRVRSPRRRPLARAVLLLTEMSSVVDAQFQDVQSQFKLLDSDGDGAVSREEYMAGARRMAEAAGTSDKQELERKMEMLQRRFEEVDLNRDGALSMFESEYMAHLAEKHLNARKHGAAGDLEARKMFEDVDVDGDGRVSEAEFLAMLTSTELDADGLGLVGETFEKSDLDGSGSLDKAELQFAAWRLQRIIAVGEQMQQSLFLTLLRLWDEDGDWKISEAELAHLAEAYDGGDGKVPPAALGWARENFARYDLDGDGTWDPDEVLGFANYVIQHRGKA